MNQQSRNVVADQSPTLLSLIVPSGRPGWPPRAATKAQPGKSGEATRWERFGARRNVNFVHVFVAWMCGRSLGGPWPGQAPALHQTDQPAARNSSCSAESRRRRPKERGGVGNKPNRFNLLFVNNIRHTWQKQTQ